MRKLSILKYYCCFALFFSAFPTLSAQFDKGQFYGGLRLGANFCQIDGDNASGYNKFGMGVGYLVGQGLGAASGGGWSYLSGAEFSVRGSRRPFDPENPGNGAFHMIMQSIDIPIYIVRYYHKFSFGLGFRTSYLLQATEKEGVILNLDTDLRKVNVLGAAFAEYKTGNLGRFFIESQYSINSIRSIGASNSIFYSTGAYYNVIYCGFRFDLGNNKNN